MDMDLVEEFRWYVGGPRCTWDNGFYGMDADAASTPALGVWDYLDFLRCSGGVPREWRTTQPGPVQARVIVTLADEPGLCSIALNRLIRWNVSPHGHSFWICVCESLRGGNALPDEVRHGLLWNLTLLSVEDAVMEGT